MQRRGFLLGAVAAPVVITTPGLLMPVRAAVLDAYPTLPHGCDSLTTIVPVANEHGVFHVRTYKVVPNGEIVMAYDGVRHFA